MEYYVVIIKDKIMLFATMCIELEDLVNEVSKKDKYRIISLIRGVLSDYLLRENKLPVTTEAEYWSMELFLLI